MAYIIQNCLFSGTLVQRLTHNLSSQLTAEQLTFLFLSVLKNISTSPQQPVQTLPLISTVLAAISCVFQSVSDSTEIDLNHYPQNRIFLPLTSYDYNTLVNVKRAVSSSINIKPLTYRHNPYAFRWNPEEQPLPSYGPSPL